MKNILAAIVLSFACLCATAQTKLPVQVRANGTHMSPTNFFFTNIFAGANITITVGTNGTITISATAAGGAGINLTNAVAWQNFYLSDTNQNNYLTVTNGHILLWASNSVVFAINLTNGATAWRTNSANVSSWTVYGKTPDSVATTPGTTAATTGAIRNFAGDGGDTTIATTGVGGIGGGLIFTGGVGGKADSATTTSTGGAGGALTYTAGAGYGPTVAATTALGGIGGGVTITAGAGGVPTAGTMKFGGNGGALTMFGGAGATGITGSNGNGGGFSVGGGAGGSGSGTGGRGGDGGAANLSGGSGGNQFSGGRGGDGGPVTINSGSGAVSATNDVRAGDGGRVTITANGGGINFRGDAGDGGRITITAGNGGASTSSTNKGGAAGNIRIMGGAGGTGMTNTVGGSLYFVPGQGTSTNHGDIYLGQDTNGTARGNVYAPSNITARAGNFWLQTNQPTALTNMVVDYQQRFSAIFATNDLNISSTTGRLAGVWQSSVLKIYTGPTNRQMWLSSTWVPLGTSTNYYLLPSNRVAVVSFASDGSDETNTAFVVATQAY